MGRKYPAVPYDIGNFKVSHDLFMPPYRDSQFYEDPELRFVSQYFKPSDIQDFSYQFCGHPKLVKTLKNIPKLAELMKKVDALAIQNANFNWSSFNCFYAPRGYVLINEDGDPEIELDPRLTSTPCRERAYVALHVDDCLRFDLLFNFDCLATGLDLSINFEITFHDCRDLDFLGLGIEEMLF